MADSPIDAIATGAGVATNSIQTGTHYAVAQADVSLRQQALQQAYDQHQEMKRQFNVQTGEKIFAMQTQAAAQPKGPYKDALIEQIRNFSDLSQTPIDETRLASLKDENWIPQWKAAAEAVGNTKGSDAYNQFMSDYVKHQALPLAQDEGTKLLSNFAMIQSGLNRGTAMAGPKNDANVTTTTKSINDDPLVKAYRSSGNGLAVALKMLKPDAKGNMPTIAVLNDAKARIVNAIAGANGAGATDFQSKQFDMDNWQQLISKELSKVSGDPRTARATSGAVGLVTSMGNAALDGVETGISQSAEAYRGMADNYQSPGTKNAALATIEPYTSGSYMARLRKANGIAMGPLSGKQKAGDKPDQPSGQTATPPPLKPRGIKDFKPEDQGAMLTQTANLVSQGATRAQIEAGPFGPMDDDLWNRIQKVAKKAGNK